MPVTARRMLTHYAVLRWQVLEPLLGERTKECGPPNKGAKKSTFAFVRLFNEAVDAADMRWLPLYNRTRQNRTTQLADLEESIATCTVCAQGR